METECSGERGTSLNRMVSKGLTAWYWNEDLKEGGGEAHQWPGSVPQEGEQHRESPEPGGCLADLAKSKNAHMVGAEWPRQRPSREEV